jgi:DNA-binding CsgD family transcriptional regulator
LFLVVTWPLVGRHIELSQLTAAISARRGAVIVGQPGVGKTTLTLAALEWAGERGMSSARTTATHASRGLPFGAFASMLPPEPMGLDFSRADLGVLLGRYVRALVDGAGGRPLVVFVDDAHLLDVGSATLVHQLAQTRAATVLATVCAGESAPDPVVSLWKDGAADRIRIDVLPDAAIEELLVAVLGGPVDTACVRQLVDRSRGNPLFLRELVSGARETGALVEGGGLWRLAGTLQPTDRLVELVALRLGELTAAERYLLELLAVGEPLGQADLDQLADSVALDSLERKGLVATRMDGRRMQVWLAHPVYGDVVRVGIGVRRERSLARCRAEVIEAVGGRRREDTLQLAWWRLVEGGGSAELMMAGAVAARARHDHALTERMARAAIDAGGGFEARFLAAEATHLQGRTADAEREAAALAARATNDHERGRVALLRFVNTHFLQLHAADVELVDDALDVITDPFWRDQLLASRFFVRSFGSGPKATMQYASTLVQGAGSGRVTAAHTSVCYCLVRSGRLDEALELLRRAELPAIPTNDEGWDRWTLFGARVEALVYGGRLGEAEELLTRAHGQVIEQPLAEATGFVTGWMAILHLEQGQPVSAFRRASESYTLFRQLGRTAPARWFYIAAAHALALSGQANEAAATLAALDALALPKILVNEADLLSARAWTAAAGGDLPAARDQLEAAAALGEEVGDLVGAASALHGLARLGRAQQVHSRLSALAAEIDGDLVTARAHYTSALAAHDSTALAKAANDFERLGANLYAAEASAEAAVVLRRTGKPREARRAEHGAARLLAGCEGAVTPAVQTVTARALLTPRELDVAMKAAAGLSNKQIAADMHISVRTAESHLQRAYEKLGVAGRHELPEALPHQPRDGSLASLSLFGAPAPGAVATTLNAPRDDPARP